MKDRVRIDKDQFRVYESDYVTLELIATKKLISKRNLIKEKLTEYFKEDGVSKKEENQEKFRRLKLRTGLSSRQLFNKIMISDPSFKSFQETEPNFHFSEEMLQKLKLLEKTSEIKATLLAEDFIDYALNNDPDIVEYKKMIEIHRLEGGEVVLKYKQRDTNPPISAATQKKIDKEKKAMDILDPTGELRGRADEIQIN